MDQPIHTGHRQRLKERFLTGGLDALSDVNCLELLLFYAVPRKDTNPLAHALLKQFGSLSGVLDAPVELLIQVPGISIHAATLMSLTLQMARRYLTDRTKRQVVLSDTEAIGSYLKPYFLGAREELVYLLCLDSKRKVIDCQKISEGTPDSANFSCRKIMRHALTVNASLVVLAHNHVNGLAIPSKEDLCSTRALFEILSSVGVTLLDHLIVADEDYVSMAESNCF